MPPPKKKEPTAQEYYQHVTGDYSSVRNKVARDIYFEQTEPHEGRPRHTRVMAVKTFRNICQKFFFDLERDIVLNGRLTQTKRTPWQDPEQQWPFGGPKQPLAEGVTEDYTETNKDILEDGN